MAKAPLKLDWSKLLPGRDDAPAPEVEVVAARAAGGGGEGESPQGDGFPVAELSDQRLQEKIQRLSNHISAGFTSRLPDRGEKLRSNLRQLQDELIRREHGWKRKDAGECERVTQSKATETSSSYNAFNPNATSSDSQSSFAFCFSKTLDDKADAAFGKELSYIYRDKYKSLTENRLQMHEGRQPLRTLSNPATVSCREVPSQCFANKGKKRLSNTGCGDVESSCISTSNGRRRLSRRLSKRRRASQSRKSIDWEFQKVQDVVLLDDEDVQPVQPKQGDVHDEWKETKMYYPSRDDPEFVELSYSDLKCLDPGSYLSSTIMNFYIQYLQRSRSSIGRPRDEYHVFNTYFYKKLEEAVSCEGDRTPCFLKLRRWWKGVNIFQKAHIFLPIHGDRHWSLVIICIPAKEDESGPIILHLDSLGLHSSNPIFSSVDSYLTEEWNYMNQNAPSPDLPISERIWKNLPRRIEKRKIMVPQQKNEYDCGLFVLYFMERFIGDAPERLRKKDLAMFGSKWFKPEEASSLRERIRELLIEEFKNSKVTESPASSGSSGNEKDPFSEP